MPTTRRNPLAILAGGHVSGFFVLELNVAHRFPFEINEEAHSFDLGNYGKRISPVTAPGAHWRRRQGKGVRRTNGWVGIRFRPDRNRMTMQAFAISDQKFTRVRPKEWQSRLQYSDTPAVREPPQIHAFATHTQREQLAIGTDVALFIVRLFIALPGFERAILSRCSHFQ